MARGRARATEPAAEKHTDNGLGREIERKLWAAADKLRGSMDAAEYKHVVLGLIFLKYISDTLRRALNAELHADFVIAHQPFKDSDWFRKDDDARWQFAVSLKGNANFALMHRFI